MKLGEGTITIGADTESFTAYVKSVQIGIGAGIFGASSAHPLGRTIDGECRRADDPAAIAEQPRIRQGVIVGRAI